jgi:glycolate oxidase
VRENSTDASRRFHPADVVVFPGSALEVQAVVRLANRGRVPIVARGGGVGYAGGAVPTHGGIVLSMRRLNRILEIDPVDLVAVVEPGVITRDLQVAVEAEGLFYPPDPASQARSSIGGNIAHNAGGPRAFKYGVTRNFVLGLDVVLPDGQLITAGGRVVKNATGYDLADLFCGAEGTLGIVTRAILRLVPRPEAAETVMALYDSSRRAADSATALIRAGVIASKLEFVDRQALAALRRYILEESIPTAVALPDSARAMLLVEVDGDRATVRADLARVRRILGEYADETIHTDRGEDLWELRRHMSAAVGRIRPHKINEDIVVPRRRIPDYLDAMSGLEAESGLPIVCFGHLGDGNIHVNLMIDADDPVECERAERVKARIFEVAVELGGTISGEHGIGIMKSDFLPIALSAPTIEAMRKIKDALDPNGIMNPGKIFP